MSVYLAFLVLAYLSAIQGKTLCMFGFMCIMYIYQSSVEEKLMKKLHEWLLKRIFKWAVIQGQEHKKNIERIYKLLREAVDKEFTEDNGPTLDAFMLECFEKSQSIYYKKSGKKQP